MGKSDKSVVHRRRVFYVPGYDPIHPRRYRELYRSESAEQARISGYEISQRPKVGAGPYGWHVNARIDGQATQADTEVLVWSDIVRGSMRAGIPGTYLLMIRTAWNYIVPGSFRAMFGLRKGPIIAALYPIAFLILQLALAIGLGLAVSLAIRLLPLGGAVSVPLQAFAGIGAGYALLKWFKSRDNRYFAYYLMHDYAYQALTKGANPPELEARIGEFRARIADAFQEDVDEVLVVGHSSGAHVAVSVLADLIRAGQLPETGPRLAFLSLGQVVPMVSFLPDAWRLRADLRYLSEQPGLFWLDVTAPGDGCTFALCDPVAVSGVASPKQRWPILISAAFTKTLSAGRWRALRWRFFRLHFQYLCAFDRPGDYDYFQITAGPRLLADRFGDRKPSESRITRAASPHVSVAPGSPKPGSSKPGSPKPGSPPPGSRP